MNLENFEFDGRMTQDHKGRLEEWHSHQIDELLDRLWETDPAFRATMEALNQADTWDISGLEYDLAGDVADWAADGFSESEWVEELASNHFMQWSFTSNQIKPCDVKDALTSAITTLKSIGLWPWS
jgi:hypothetical protein